MMSVEIEITMAAPEDARTLGTVMLRAMEPHMIDRFMVPEEDFRAAFDAKMNWFLSSYTTTLADPKKRIFKATVKSTGEVVALGGIHYHDGNFESVAENLSKSEGSTTNLDLATTAIPKKKIPAGFAEYYLGELGRIHQNHMHGVKHVGMYYLFD